MVESLWRDGGVIVESHHGFDKVPHKDTIYGYQDNGTNTVYRLSGHFSRSMFHAK